MQNWNKRGWFWDDWDLPEFDIDMSYVILMLTGAIFGIFTASGGFSFAISGEPFNPGWFVKLVSAAGGALAGYLIAWKFSS